MATIKFPNEMPVAGVIAPGDKMMISKAATGEAYQATFNDAKNFLEITGNELEPIASGALPTPLAGQIRTMDVVGGKNGSEWTHPTLPGGKASLTSVEKGRLFFNGSVWRLRNIQQLPQIEPSDGFEKASRVIPGSSSNDIVLNIHKSDKVIGKNKFSKNDVSNKFGWYLNSLDQELPLASRFISHYIPIRSGDPICLSGFSIGGAKHILYNSDFIPIELKSSNIFTATQNGYLRFSGVLADIERIQCEVGEVVTSFEPYTDINKPLNAKNIIDSTIIGDKIKDHAITPVKTAFFDTLKSTNLFNLNDPDVVPGFSLTNNGFPTNPNSQWITTGFIKVNAGDIIYYGNNGIRFNTRFIIGYNSNKAKVSGGEDTNREYFVVPIGTEYIRGSFNFITYKLFQINVGSIKPYEEYFDEKFKLHKEYIDDKDLIRVEKNINSVRGENSNVSKFNLLLASTVYAINDFPFHPKKGISFSLSIYFSSFGGVTVGKGYQKYRGIYYEITPTHIIQKRFETAEIVGTPVAHGLTISSFLRFSVSINDNAKANVVLFSKGGQFKHTFTTYYEYNYEAFVLPGTHPLSDVVLTFGSGDFKKSVWVFTDSYGGVASNRWPGVIKDMGYFDFLLNGLAGQSSNNAYPDLIRSLNYGTPKYLLWFLGMNDSDVNYINNFTRVISLCNAKGIELILSTIPTVPTRNKEIISQTVRDSGFRYVDFYKAVGANDTGNWYEGYLSADGIHPTDLGAQALANQILIDFPEIMQYDMISTDASGNITGDN